MWLQLIKLHSNNIWNKFIQICLSIIEIWAVLRILIILSLVSVTIVMNIYDNFKENEKLNEIQTICDSIHDV